jgi:hypothetical protein
MLRGLFSGVALAGRWCFMQIESLFCALVAVLWLCWMIAVARWVRGVSGECRWRLTSFGPGGVSVSAGGVRRNRRAPNAEMARGGFRFRATTLIKSLIRPGRKWFFD